MVVDLPNTGPRGRDGAKARMRPSPTLCARRLIPNGRTEGLSTNPDIGSEVAGYRLEEVIGRGGMGVVYRAEQIELGRHVAVKLIRPELGEDKEFRERFERESRLAASIEHPNVIPVYQAGSADGHLYIAMRFIEGTDLRELLQTEGRLTVERTTRIVTQIAAALDAAHAKGLVHRDVKPANVLLDTSENTYLTDFGLTKAVSSNTVATHTGQWLGSIDYAAPEQIEGRSIDARTDVYALGCVLFQLLTNALPYERDSDMAKMWAKVNETPRLPTEALANLAPAFDAVIARALSYDPESRYPSAGDLARAVRAAAKGKSLDEPGQSVAVGEAAGAPTAVLAQTGRGDTAVARTAAVGIPGRIAAPPDRTAAGPRVATSETSSEPRKTWIAATVVLVALIAAGAAVAVVSIGKNNGSTSKTIVTKASSNSQSKNTGTKATAQSRSAKPARSVVAKPTPPLPTPGPVDALRRHFALLERGQYAAAATDLTSTLMNDPSIGGTATWIAGQEADPLSSAQLNTAPAVISGDSATVQVYSLVTQAAASGCNAFSGSYGLTRYGGRWLISSVDLSKSSC